MIYDGLYVRHCEPQRGAAIQYSVFLDRVDVGCVRQIT